MNLNLNKKSKFAFLLMIAALAGTFNFCFLHANVVFGETINLDRQEKNLSAPILLVDSCADSNLHKEDSEEKNADKANNTDEKPALLCCITPNTPKTETSGRSPEKSMPILAVLTDNADYYIENSNQYSYIGILNISPPEADLLFSVFKKE